MHRKILLPSDLSRNMAQCIKRETTGLLSLVRFQIKPVNGSAVLHFVSIASSSFSKPSFLRRTTSINGKREQRVSFYSETGAMTRRRLVRTAFEHVRVGHVLFCGEFGALRVTEPYRCLVRLEARDCSRLACLPDHVYGLHTVLHRQP